MSTSRKGECRTIVYVHGIKQSKGPAALKLEWDGYLGIDDSGERTRMAYWASSASGAALSPRDARDLFSFEEGDITVSQEDVSAVITQLTSSPERARALEAVARQLLRHSGAMSREARAGSSLIRARAYEWIPGEISYAFIKRFLREVHDFLYVPERRDTMKRAVRERILAGGVPPRIRSTP